VPEVRMAECHLIRHTTIFQRKEFKHKICAVMSASSSLYVMKMFENGSPFISIIKENNLTAVQNIHFYFIL
jgi:hypothetical protein